jgi:tetratricopeptide (TPR) repeat protein
MSHTGGLTDWWLSAFTAEERRLIVERFRPLGGGSGWITEDEIRETPGGPVALLTNLAGWFHTSADRHLATRMLEKAEQLVAEGASRNILDVHFMYMAEIQANYPDRDSRRGALDAAIRSCYSQIALSQRARAQFRKEYGDPIPAHTGFNQLAIIREKQGEYDEAIRLCTRAKEEGWMGDWDKRIARCQRKLEKLKK